MMGEKIYKQKGQNKKIDRYTDSRRWERKYGAKQTRWNDR